MIQGDLFAHYGEYHLTPDRPVRGIVCALDYLKSFYPVILFKDELHKRAGITVSYGALERKLREAAASGKILRIEAKTETGKTIVKYQHNPDYKQVDRVKDVL